MTELVRARRLANAAVATRQVDSELSLLLALHAANITGQAELPIPEETVEGYDLVMTDQVQTLLRGALSLSEEERADLIAELLVGLEGPVEADELAVDRAWAEALERRARRVVAGETSGEDWSLVRERVGRALTDG